MDTASKDLARSDAPFYLAMAVVSAILLFIGFAPSFYLRGVIPAPAPPLYMLSMAHGLVFTAWVLLFIAQAALAAANRLHWHRELGMALAVLFGAVLALGVSIAVTAGRLGHIPPGAPPPLVFMALPLIGLTSSGVLIVAALLNRRRSDWHKRLMIAGLITFTAPGTGRIAIPLGLATHQAMISLVAAEVLLAICIAYDFARYRRLHPAYIFAIVVYVMVHIGVVWAFHSPAWLAFAHFITAT